MAFAYHMQMRRKEKSQSFVLYFGNTLYFSTKTFIDEDIGTKYCPVVTFQGLVARNSKKKGGGLSLSLLPALTSSLQGKSGKKLKKKKKRKA